MKVFTNTGPLIALASIQQLDLLHRIFGTIHVANAVVEECEHGGPIEVPNLRSMDWLRLAGKAREFGSPYLTDLDRGERETIALAIEHQADLVIIDERLGRRAAEFAGLSITGSLGVLAKAKAAGLIESFVRSANALQENGIRFNAALISKVAARVGEMA